MENNEANVKITEIRTNAMGIQEAGRALAALAGSIGDILRAMHAATKPGQLPDGDVEQVVADAEKALHIGAAVCMFAGEIMSGDEHEDAEDAAEGAVK